MICYSVAGGAFKNLKEREREREREREKNREKNY